MKRTAAEAQLPAQSNVFSNAAQLAHPWLVLRDLLPRRSDLHNVLSDIFITNKYRIGWAYHNARTGKLIDQLGLGAHSGRKSKWQQFACID